MDFWANVGTIFTMTFVRCVLYLLSWWLLFATLFVILSMLYVTYEEYPRTWTRFIAYYNANLGPWVGEVVLAPLEFLDAMLRGILPLWDAAMWWGKTILIEGLLPVALRESTTLYKMARALLDFARYLSNALLLFAESFSCSGGACLVPENRVLDVLSSLGQVRLPTGADAASLC